MQGKGPASVLELTGSEFLASLRPGGSALPRVPGRTYVRNRMERQFELESLRRSLAMLRPGAPALDREEAMRLVRELQALERQVRTMRQGLVRLLEQTA